MSIRIIHQGNLTYTNIQNKGLYSEYVVSIELVRSEYFNSIILAIINETPQHINIEVLSGDNLIQSQLCKSHMSIDMEFKYSWIELHKCDSIRLLNLNGKILVSAEIYI